MPISEKQLAANRRNARKSTGPRTAAGKARSSRNNLKHGLCTSLKLLPGEDPGEFDALARTIFEDVKPVNGFEASITDRIVVNIWRLRRAARAEADLLASEPLSSDLSGSHVPASLDALSRHEARFHQMFCSDLLLLQTFRAAGHERRRNTPPPNVAPAERFDRWGRLIGPDSTVPLHAELLRLEKELGLHGGDPGPQDAEGPA